MCLRTAVTMMAHLINLETPLLEVCCLFHGGLLLGSTCLQSYSARFWGVFKASFSLSRVGVCGTGPTPKMQVIVLQRFTGELSYESELQVPLRVSILLRHTKIISAF